VIVCRTLGPVEVIVDGVPAPPELLWRKHLALLIYLARSPRRTRSREHLIGLLWADRTEAAARHSLSEALRVIRRYAGQVSVEVTVGQVGLTGDAVELDVDRLEELAAAGDWEAASALVAGEFLEGFAVPDASEFEDWLAGERERWRRQGVEVLVRYADRLARAGKAQEA
jgi:DNA-binding SARP family transcriptional activator